MDRKLSGRDAVLEPKGKITFLFGAGASIPAGVPAVVQFVGEFAEHLRSGSERQRALSTSLQDLLKAWRRAAGEETGFPAQIGLERLYELLTHIEGHEEAEQSLPLSLPSYFPARSRATELLAWELKKYVQKRCLGFDRNRLNYLRPLVRFIDPVTGLDILSLNYDTCVESLLDDHRRSWVDGLSEVDRELRRFTPQDFLRKPSDETVRLLKLHGSASWYQTGSGVIQRVVERSQHSVGWRLGTAKTMTHEAMMVYPTLNKALTTGPFPSLMLAARQVLAETDLLLAVGYGFADRHVRELILAAMAEKPSLRLVLVNPWPDEIVEELWKSASRTVELRGRIGVCGEERRPDGALVHGFVDRALADSWLWERSQQWLSSAPLDDPSPRLRDRVGRKGARWNLRFQVGGGAAHIALGRRTVTSLANESREADSSTECLWMVSDRGRRLLALDLASGERFEAGEEFSHARGIAWDSRCQRLYLLENVYQRPGKWIDPAFIKRNGIGRLWAVNSSGHRQEALTRAHLSRTLLRWLRSRSADRSMSETLKQSTGLLVWPTRILVEKPGETLLLTEAQRLLRLDLRTGKTTVPIEIPLCFNLVGLSRGPDSSIFLADGGVHPTGRGRVMQADLRTGQVEVLAQGPTAVDDVLWHSSSDLVLVSINHGWPRGRVLAYRKSGSRLALVSSWEGLDSAHTLIEGFEPGTALVGTAEGVVELDLKSVWS